jgi:hypothetical protein
VKRFFLCLAAVSSLAAQTPNLAVAVGDSLTSGTGGGTPYLEYVNLPEWTKRVYGLEDGTCLSLQSSTPGVTDHTPAAVRRIAVLWCGAEDAKSTTPATGYERLVALAGIYRGKGFSVVVGTMISRTGSCNGGLTCDQWKNQYNALIRANWPSFADNIADFAKIPSMGADGAYSTGLYDGDHVHLANAGYQSVIAPVVQGAIDGLGAQVWVRFGAPGGTWILSYDKDAEGCARIRTARPHGLSAGDYVFQDGLLGTDANKVRHHASNLNRTAMVRTVPDPTHYTLNDLQGNCLAPNDTWINGHGQTSGSNSASWMGKVRPYTLPAGAHGGILAGSHGFISRKIASSTDTGMVSLTVSGHTATLTFEYAHGAAVGNSIGIHNTSASGNLNGTHTITAVTTYTIQFSTDTGDGDYTYRNECGPSPGNPNLIGGTKNCVVASLFAHDNNPDWVQVKAQATFATDAAFKHVFDGGSINYFWNDYSQWFIPAAYRAYVDRTYQPAVSALVYFLSHPERIAGVNWAGHYGSDYGGSTAIGHYFSNWAFPVSYAVAREYLTPEQRAWYADSMFNDVDDPDPAKQCTPQVPSQVTIATGAAQGGDGTHITLAGDASSADDFYVNNVVAFQDGPKWFWGNITNYNGSTKSATVSNITSVTANIPYYDVSLASGANNESAWAAPKSGATYRILATASVNGTTITGYNTQFLTDLADGDAVQTGRIWSYSYYPESLFYVSQRTSNTSLTAVLGGRAQVIYDQNSAQGPQPVWVLKKFDQSQKHCGAWWRFKLIMDTPGGAPLVYPPSGGRDSANINFQNMPPLGQEGGGNHVWALGVASTVALDDARARKAFTSFQSYDNDWLYSITGAYRGLPYDSTRYGHLAQNVALNWNTQVLHNLMPGLYTSERVDPLLDNIQAFRVFSLLNDKAGDKQHIWVFGANLADSGIIQGGGANVGFSYTQDVRSIVNPTADHNRHMKKIESDLGLYMSLWAFQRFPYHDPNVTPLDLSLQPKQKAIIPSQAQIDACVAFSGRPGEGEFGCEWATGHAWFSKTSWTDRTATEVLYEARACCLGYDNPAGGVLHVYKVGHLIAPDSLPPGNSPSNQGEDLTERGDMPRFNEQNTLGSAPGTYPMRRSKITRWARQRAGAADYRYGDAEQSVYVYSRSEAKDMYYPKPTRVVEDTVHFKGGDTELIVQYNDIDAGSAQPHGIRHAIHYAQNGENGSVNEDGANTYNEGATRCAEAECSNATKDVSLGATETIISQENGAAGDNLGPERKYGVLTRVFSPHTIALKWDGTYEGGYGHTNRVRVCSGASCGAAAAKLETVTVHKITSSLSDTTLTAGPLNVTGWTGVQTEGKVAMFSRGGQLRNALAFPTSHSGTAQYLIAGLAPGTYSVHVNAVPVTTSAVGDDDNSLYFESTSGAVSINAVTAQACEIGTPVLAAAMVGTSYSQQVQTTNCAAPLQWSISAGALCAGLTLDAVTGTIAGTPAAAQSCNFTMQVADGTGQSATKDYSLTVARRAGRSLSRQVSCTGCVW